MFKSVLVIGFFFITFSHYAQDVQLSQYYNTPLYLNPALAGAGLDTRIGTNYRMQWPGLTNPYTSFSAWADHDFYKKRSGLGFVVQRSVQGNTSLRTTTMDAIYSYQINITDRWTVKPALEIGLGMRDFDLSKSIFGDQLTNSGVTGNATTDALAGTSNNVLYPDISSGVVAYNRNLWLGVSSYHINRPNEAFSGNQRSLLPIKWNYIGGYKILLQERQIAWGAPIQETSITPTFLYKTQGTSQQLDLGLYINHNFLMAGLWYRGIPVLKYSAGVPNSESIVLMAGLNHKGLTFCYSYDVVVSQLAGLSGGAHEISLIYQWQTDKTNRKGKKGHRPMPCPNVDRQYKQKTFNE
ncbi:MAG TPA: type IX secretion system membrane protein PorP/SprF [Cytophagaceae bacterium]|nr:type IX secretion system membrane protein PorP/SprF [Cytophagaceae bacterium]